MSVHRFWKGNTALSIVVDDFKDDGPDDAYIEEIRLHLSGAAGVADYVVFIESSEGPEYNSVLSTNAMNGLTDKYLTPGHIIRAEDHLKLVWPNATNLTWGIELIYKRNRLLDG
jgi:hypothetical protein